MDNEEVRSSALKQLQNQVFRIPRVVAVSLTQPSIGPHEVDPRDSVHITVLTEGRPTAETEQQVSGMLNRVNNRYGAIINVSIEECNTAVLGQGMSALNRR